MTRRPKVTDPTQGQYQVVISFRVTGPVGPKTAEEHFHGVFPHMDHHGWRFDDLDVAVRVIGAQGETSMYEHPVGLATTEDVERVQAAPKPRDDVPVKGDRL